MKVHAYLGNSKIIFIESDDMTQPTLKNIQNL